MFYEVCIVVKIFSLYLCYQGFYLRNRNFYSDLVIERELGNF